MSKSTAVAPKCFSFAVISAFAGRAPQMLVLLIDLGSAGWMLLVVALHVRAAMAEKTSEVVTVSRVTIIRSLNYEFALFDM